jgi:hypothetical protein
VAVDLPPGPEVAGEALPLGRGQLLPEEMDVGPERVDDAAPVDAGLGRAAHLAAD